MLLVKPAAPSALVEKARPEKSAASPSSWQVTLFPTSIRTGEQVSPNGAGVGALTTSMVKVVVFVLEPRPICSVTVRFRGTANPS